MTVLEQMKEKQEAGWRVCPRCGRSNMISPLRHNALSRVADIYICPDCGMDEALRDFGRIPLPIEEWAIAIFMLANGK